MTPPQKPCKDCRYATDTRQCHHPKVAERLYNYYEGNIYTAHPYCQTARLIGRCGTEGKFWEPIEIGFGPPLTEAE